MKELKPCPFCGSEATIWLSPDRRTLFVQCDECLTKSDLFRSIDEAVQAWNRRKIEKDEVFNERND